MSERLELLKNKFEKRLKKFKDRTILVKENIRAAAENRNAKDLKSSLFEGENKSNKRNSFSKARKRVKTAKKNLRTCLAEGRFEDELDGIRGCSEKYEEVAIAYLNLAHFCLQKTELAAIKALEATMAANEQNHLEESDLD
ncbi:MAG: hypothetical protein AAGJ12_00040 [Bacteroidota bacterium]